jgi:hypothetical protein
LDSNLLPKSTDEMTLVATDKAVRGSMLRLGRCLESAATTEASFSHPFLTKCSQ